MDTSPTSDRPDLSPARGPAPGTPLETLRETLPTRTRGGRTIGIYSAERSVIDAFRLRHLDGPDLVNEALKRWLRGGGQPSELLRLAKTFPRTLTPLRRFAEQPLGADVDGLVWDPHLAAWQ